VVYIVFDRWYADALREKLKRPYVHLLFGARQTGKSTLLNAVLPPETVKIDLADPEERSLHLSYPGEFVAICKALPETEGIQYVFVDEAQSVPSIFDAVQHLYDIDKKRWRFILCGSSARKLRRTGANLLPGRSFLHHLFPLICVEHQARHDLREYTDSPLQFKWNDRKDPIRPFPAWDLQERLAYGSLPGIVTADEEDRPELLRAFSLIHLEEEIRREAFVKDWGAFVRFLRLAAIESGGVLNYAALSQQTGVSLPTVKSYYQLIEDMFIGFSIPAYTKSRRKNLLSTPRFFFFDTGVRNAAAGLKPSPDIVLANPGPLFEQWVGIELWKRLQYIREGSLHYMCSKDGLEIDYIVEQEGQLTPVEVKWTEHPSSADARHLMKFLDEHAHEAHRGYIICRVPKTMAVNDKVKAIPWFCL